MQKLNLPDCQLNIKRNKKGAFVVLDTLRRRFVTVTPEEWVRQHFVAFLIGHKGYPKALMANEVSLLQNGIKRRCDTLVADRTGNPLVIVEYKAPSISITQAVFDQIARYNMVLHARYLIVSNGMQHYCCRIDYEHDTYAFMREIPAYCDLEQPSGEK